MPTPASMKRKPSADNPSRQPVSIEDALRRIGPGETIHTYRQAGPVLVGCDWDRADLVALMESVGVEESGPNACAYKHCLCVMDGTGPMWIEAVPA